jgi:hypothetical protein
LAESIKVAVFPHVALIHITSWNFSSLHLN